MAVNYNLLKASWLQKSIRRGLKNKSYFIGELYIEDNQIEGLKRRLKVFSTEDIGLATPEIVFVLDYFKDQPLKQIIALSGVMKNREVDRFLLQVRDNSERLLKRNDNNITKEVNVMIDVINLSSKWFNNKRKKINEENLKNYFYNLDKESKYTSVINLCLNNYFELSKKKTLGARTQLAFLVLLIVRNIKIDKNRINDIINKVNEYKIDDNIKFKFVDDWAIDKHTVEGKKLNRDYNFWVKHGSLVHPEKEYKELYDKNSNLKYEY